MKQIILVIITFFSVACNAQTVEQVAKELVRQGVPHSRIVLAQARLESGNFKSALYKRTNNPFGIKHNGKYAHYSDWRKAIADYKKRISSRYNGGDYFAFLRRIGYAEDPAYSAKIKRIINASNP